MLTKPLLLLTLASAATAVARLAGRVPEPANTSVNPAAIKGTNCTDKTKYAYQYSNSINANAVRTLVSHDINVALLQICGGIAGKIEQCAGDPTTTTGASGTAKFTLTVATAGQVINITKGRWEGCVRAARAVCGDTPFTTTCIGGANSNAGNVDVTLAAV
ncbi:hypothetical protein ONS95_012519 [Cadophora gregata]|uniref:uncharacterized protein n=1 Tax=Cadophora gregata TaxID=51156 RepID=UPI0026DD4F0D|nr:uncharacterized protein ONS95_012519 [Cadophora gregata]KAK0118215.1 hypothetical protein ONS95_012519 [Cadophora gregata]